MAKTGAQTQARVLAPERAHQQALFTIARLAQGKAQTLSDTVPPGITDPGERERVANAFREINRPVERSKLRLIGIGAQGEIPDVMVCAIGEGGNHVEEGITGPKGLERIVRETDQMQELLRFARRYPKTVKGKLKGREGYRQFDIAVPTSQRGVQAMAQAASSSENWASIRSL